MDYLGILDLSFLKEKNSQYVCGTEKNRQYTQRNRGINDSNNDVDDNNEYIVKATNNFKLVLTEGTKCDDKIDDVIKKWNDKIGRAHV